MDISLAKRFVWHDVLDDVIYISRSLDAIRDKNKFFPTSVWGVVPTDSGEKMISVDIDYEGEPYLQGGIFGVFVHWEYFSEMYKGLKRVEL